MDATSQGRKNAASNAKRGKFSQKVSREIYYAGKSKGLALTSAMNLLKRLASPIKAKSANMPQLINICARQ